MPCKRMPAYITGGVKEDLLRRIEYLLEENRYCAPSFASSRHDPPDSSEPSTPCRIPARRRLLNGRQSL
jgi:hypothetical protein